MPLKTTRREFLKYLAAFAAAQGLGRKRLEAAARQASAGRPNILVVVYDTLSAEHMSVYGYPRSTTPRLDRFAQQAAVFHRHYTAGNFTTPGTASLLTGVYPWSHRAFNIAACVDDSYAQRNLFSALAGSGYYRMAYTHNLLADFFLNQFRAEIDLHLPPETFFLKGTPTLERLLPGDREAVYRGEHFLTRILESGKVLPGSLFLSLVNEIGLEQYEATFNPALAELFPEGLPEEDYTKSFFVLEEVIDGMIDLIGAAPHPFLAYFHLYPPHHPYHPRREFVGRFDDGWGPPEKPVHFFAGGQDGLDLNERRRKYDEYLAYADSEFGRLADFLQQAGLMENTWVVFTSDHGEMFERGIKGHNTPVLYDPLLRVPLLIHRPGQREREDVFTPTSAVDVLPTLALAAGRNPPDWCEGRPLPAIAGGAGDPRRPIYALDARQNGKYRPLEIGTVAMMKDFHKLIAYYGYRNFDRQYELYHIADDPQEMVDLAQGNASAAASLIDELEITLKQINLAFHA